MKSGRRLSVVLSLACGLLLAGRAAAFLDTGTLLTKAASATYMGGGQGTSVTYSATAKILVANPAIFLYKDVNPTYVSASAGGTVTFSLCFSNGGANSAFNITINDHIPNNATYITAGYSAFYADISGSNGTPIATWATGPAGPWTGGPPPNMQTGNMYIHWVVPNLGVAKSGCIYYSILFN